MDPKSLNSDLVLITVLCFISQEGNRALDLALMEKNRRCVVALQEYSERSEEMNISPDQICGKILVNDGFFVLFLLVISCVLKTYLFEF